MIDIWIKNTSDVSVRKRPTLFHKMRVMYYFSAKRLACSAISSASSK